VPIRLLLQNEAVFTPEDIAALTTAFDGALSDLGLADRDDPIVRLVAKRIIELAKKGELDPILLRDYVVRQFQARNAL
jgi:hypothetical protein